MAERIIANCATRLNGLLLQEPRQLRGAEDGIRSLIHALECRRPFLKRADDDRGDDRNRIKEPVKVLISASSDAEIAVETYLHERKRRNRKPINGCVDHCMSAGSLRRFLNQIEDIERRVNGIDPTVESNGGTHVEEEEEEEEELRSSTTGGPSMEEEKVDPGFNEDKVVGLDDDIKGIVGQFTEGDPRRSIVSIVGMGGLGKTTLAKKVYEHMSVKKHFSCKAWVTVSLRYRRKKEILLDFVRCLWGKPDGQLLEMDDGKLKEEIFKYLKGKRYILVVDDIWRIEDWEFLKDFLPDSSNGSRVLLTTRSRDIAESAADPTSAVKELQLLGEEHSWELLCVKAFPHLRGRCPTGYEQVGRLIAHKCGGLPLQLLVLGGLLQKKKKLEDWNRVLTGVDWELGLEDRTSRVLALSYDDLPGRLKTCFLYLSVFPEDYDIPSSRLVRLWVAEGFVEQQAGEETMTMEEVAEGYLEALIKRNLVMAVRRNVYGSVETCRVHDLLLDLSVSEAGHMWFLDVRKDVQVDDPPTEDDVRRPPRRIASHFVIPERSPPLNFSPTICSLIHFGEWRYMFKRFMTMDSMLEGLNLLRVVDLDLGSAPEKILLNGIGRKTLLTHLALDWGPSPLNFPSSIGNLHNLQTLDLRGGSPVYLPAAIWNLEKLRHLKGETLYIDGQPRGNRRYDLQTLSGVRDPDGWNKSCRLARLTNLRRLVVFWIHKFSNEGPLSEALRGLKSLRSLELTLQTRRDIDVEVTTENMKKLLVFQEHKELCEMNLHGRIGEQLPVAPNGGFPPNVTKLYLSQAKLTKTSFATLEQLPKLKFLTILDGSYAEKELVCHAGGFLHLESLEINHIDELEKWEVEEGAMPMLRTLTISYCGRLEMLPEGLQHMKTLQELLLKSMTESLLARVQEGKGEDWRKVQHIPTITIEDVLNVQALAAVGWENRGSTP